MCFPVYVKMHIKDPLLHIGKYGRLPLKLHVTKLACQARAVDIEHVLLKYLPYFI